MKNILLIMTGLLLFFTACPRGKAAETQTITAKEAYRMMGELDNYILLDVRIPAEFQETRIDGAVLIPDYEIKDRAETELPDKNAVIFVYCRSGRRSAQAAADLAALGYKNIYDFGGIINWPYKTVSG
ncbi:MAG: rhodanese-like domain-containing protein [Treponema sp.]|jgi:rhodanese-related sulfurtransferase|nr:rhodanese-like domain-containing protein [Treponema sp.]